MTKKKKIIILILSLIAIIAIISNIVDPDINGMDFTLIGDSIMKGYGNQDKGFEYYFSNALYRSKINNYASDAATLSENNGTNYMVIKDQIDLIKGDPQVILLDGGANDIMGYCIGTYPYANQKPIGTVNTEIDGVTEGDTVIHHFEDTIRILKEKYPSSRICYVQMFFIDDDTINHITINESIKPEIRQRRDDLWREIKIACEKWKIDYIDVSSKFYETDIKYRQADWIHINDIGYKYITPYVLKELERIY